MLSLLYKSPLHPFFGELLFPYWKHWTDDVTTSHTKANTLLTLSNTVSVTLSTSSQSEHTDPGWRYQYQWSLARIVLLWDFHIEDWKEILFSPLYYELKSCDLRSVNGHICRPVEKPEKWELWRCRSWEMRAGMRRALDKSYLSLWFQSLGPVLYFIFHALIT